MITDANEKDQFPNINPECNSTVISGKTATSTSNSRLWSGLRDPRIVRVSKAFGGKDRHSKVSTIRGLRDRRVRLSVPTAIQLYDLQDRLGLNQPSKVVDWLLDAAQHEINKLPPLDFPVENFIQFHESFEQSSKAKNDHQRLNLEGQQRQLEIASAASMYQDIDIYNGQSPSHHQDHNQLYINSRGGGGDQASSLIGIGGFPYASSYHNWPDQSNRSYFSQFGFISSQVDVAPSSVYASYMTSSTVSSELDGISAQQNIPLNGSAMFRNSFHSGSPKARSPF